MERQSEAGCRTRTQRTWTRRAARKEARGGRTANPNRRSLNRRSLNRRNPGPETPPARSTSPDRSRNPMRIVGGVHKGRTIAAPKGERVRPTSDRTREALFNILAHAGFEGFALEGARVLDLFAGSGALGIEALSRGAGFALFVEEHPESRAAIRENMEALGL